MSLIISAQDKTYLPEVTFHKENSTLPNYLLQQLSFRDISVPKENRNFFKTIVNSKLFLSIILFVILLTGSGFVFNHFYDIGSILNPKNLLDDRSEKERVLQHLSEITSIPKDEIPEIKFVSDKSEYKIYSFYSNIQEGDVIFYFKKIKKVFAYRESNRILLGVSLIKTENVAGINTNSNSISSTNSSLSKSKNETTSNTTISKTSSSTTAPTTVSSSSTKSKTTTYSFKVRIINTRADSELAIDFKNQLITEYGSDITVTGITNSSSKKYIGNKLVVVSGGALDFSDKLSMEQDLEIIEIPDTEIPSKVDDILIIIGN